MRWLLPLLILVPLLVAPRLGTAQPRVPVGVVWDVPADSAQALADLAAMQDAGVRVVRTEVVEQEFVLAAATRRGIAVYQDLPIRTLPAVRLRDTLAFAQRTLAEVLARSAAHPSARHFGLAVGSDTSDPAACAYFEQLQRLIREHGPPGATTYYVSRFVDDDVCADEVDVVLLAALDADPDALIVRWQAHADTPVGLAVGAAVRPRRDGGHAVPASAEAQARTLETHLRAALDAEPWTVLVYRWRDSGQEGALLATSVSATEYGLRDEDDQPRPAFDVMAGLFTGQQTLFAIDAGVAPEGRRPTLLVMVGWLLVLALAYLYWLTPTFQVLATEHILRPSMYQDAVRRARGVEGWQTAAMAGVLALGVGVIWVIALRTLGQTDVLGLLVAGLPPNVLRGLNMLLQQSMLLVVLVGSLYALTQLINVVAMAVLARANRLLPAQALTLTVWARWPMLVLLIAAMALASQPPSLGLAVWALGLLAVWVVAELIGQIRALVDLGGVAQVPLARALGLGFVVPFLLGLLTLSFVAAAARPELEFLWHLVTRS
ncbi:MAG: hypothetical protein AAF624_18840 [Bacteroidota bacterium]